MLLMANYGRLRVYINVCMCVWNYSHFIELHVHCDGRKYS